MHRRSHERADLAAATGPSQCIVVHADKVRAAPRPRKTRPAHLRAFPGAVVSEVGPHPVWMPPAGRPSINKYVCVELCVCVCILSPLLPSPPCPSPSSSFSTRPLRRPRASATRSSEYLAAKHFAAGSEVTAADVAAPSSPKSKLLPSCTAHTSPKTGDATMIVQLPKGYAQDDSPRIHDFW